MFEGIYPRDNTTGNSSAGPVTASTVLAANSSRVGFIIQNQSTNILYVYFGASASSSVYSFILKACTATADGTGGSISMTSGVVYRGLITAGGTNPSYSVIEF